MMGEHRGKNNKINNLLMIVFVGVETEEKKRERNTFFESKFSPRLLMDRKGGGVFCNKR